MVIGPNDDEVRRIRGEDIWQASVGVEMGSGKEECVLENSVLTVQLKGKPSP